MRLQRLLLLITLTSFTLGAETPITQNKPIGSILDTGLTDVKKALHDVAALVKSNYSTKSVNNLFGDAFTAQSDCLPVPLISQGACKTSVNAFLAAEKAVANQLGGKYSLALLKSLAAQLEKSAKSVITNCSDSLVLNSK